MANKVYVAPETVITFKASGGTVLFTPTSLGDQAGRVSTQLDRGSGSHAAWYEWRSWCKGASAPTVGKGVRVFLAGSDGTIQDGNIGVTDAAVSATSAFALNKCNNLRPLGAMIADADAAFAMYASGYIFIPTRYLSVYWFSDLGVSLSSTAADHGFSLTPIPDELQ